MCGDGNVCAWHKSGVTHTNKKKENRSFIFRRHCKHDKCGCWTWVWNDGCSWCRYTTCSTCCKDPLFSFLPPFLLFIGMRSGLWGQPYACSLLWTVARLLAAAMLKCQHFNVPKKSLRSGLSQTKLAKLTVMWAKLEWLIFIFGY